MAEHPAARRWAVERYDRKRAGLGVHGITQLETLAKRAESELLPVDQTERRLVEAEHQAVHDELKDRKKSYGLD